MACQFEIMRPWYLITLIVGLLAPIFNSQEVPVNTPIPGAFAKPFSVPIINKSTFNFDPESIFRPMIGFVHSIEDPFSMEALHRQASLDELMTSEIAADVLLLATDEPSQQDLTATMAAALANLTTTQRQFWTTHLHVANASVAVLNATWPDAEPLVSWLASWQTLTRTLSWHSNGIQVSRCLNSKDQSSDWSSSLILLEYCVYVCKCNAERRCVWYYFALFAMPRCLSL
eukprot:TRINITY_DN12364_c1_g5_i3.p2 TRINITY_DN12364_c1_g5~~TRINITY_DN12364_c1_g5_i3.p2  ORF type:complete len:230 (+),score=13.35 TRINITY_DN12364_c1_g5_i3:2723-3412(+)